MSQRDLAAELGAASLSAPPELRIRVRAIAAAATDGPRRRMQLRRGLVLALPIAAAIAAAIVLTRPMTDNHQKTFGLATTQSTRDAAQGRLALPSAKAAATAPGPTPSPSKTRAQRYGADLTLRIPTAAQVSVAVTQALRITSSLGGYAAGVHVDRTGRVASASLSLRVPRSHVQEAVRRLAALGSVTHERIDVQDLQAGVNNTDRTIARLQRQLRELRAQTQTPDVVQRIATLTAQVERLQRNESTTIRTASYATIAMSLGTPPVLPHHTNWWPWATGGGAAGLFAVLFALGAWRVVRRRREAALLSRS